MSDPRVTRDHRGMILRPDLWQHFSLPLKRYPPGVSDYEVAVLKAAPQTEDAPVSVHVNLSMYGPLGEVREVLYANVDALLADGWVVD